VVLIRPILAWKLGTALCLPRLGAAGNRYCVADFLPESRRCPPHDLLGRCRPVTMGAGGPVPLPGGSCLPPTRLHRHTSTFHGPGRARCRGALAEWVHGRIRLELGFGSEEPALLRRTCWAQALSRQPLLLLATRPCPKRGRSRPQLGLAGRRSASALLDWMRGDQAGAETEHPPPGGSFPFPGPLLSVPAEAISRGSAGLRRVSFLFCDGRDGRFLDGVDAGDSRWS